jgi:chondroitin AC lyase
LKNVLGAGSHKISDVKWIHHSGLAYIPLKPATFNIRLKEVSGRWSSINISEPDALVKEKVFTPMMLHDKTGSYSTGYAIALCKTPEQAQKLAENPGWKLIRNDKDCQAISFANNVVMLAFSSPGKIKITNESIIKADKPCLIMIKEKKLYVSDPSHKGITVGITFNDRVFSVKLPKDGTTKTIVYQ